MLAYNLDTSSQAQDAVLNPLSRMAKVSHNKSPVFCRTLTKLNSAYAPHPATSAAVIEISNPLYVRSVEDTFFTVASPPVTHASMVMKEKAAPRSGAKQYFRKPISV